jgi:hypothetical protein
MEQPAGGLAAAGGVDRCGVDCRLLCPALVSRAANPEKAHEQFFTAIALAEPARITAEAVMRELTWLGGPAPLDMALTQASLKTAPGGFMLQVSGIEVVVLPMAQPLPRDGYETAAQGSLLWKDAERQLAANKAHVVVAALKASNNHAEALAAAFAVTVVAAAVMRVTPAIGGVFNPACTAYPADEFIGFAIGLAQKRQIPEMLWVLIGFLPGPVLSGGRETAGLVTRGLSAFIGREIEFMPVLWQPGEIARRVLGLTQYLILNGAVIKDGDTVGDTPAEHIKVRLKDSGHWLQGPVLSLEPEGSVR